MEVSGDNWAPDWCEMVCSVGVLAPLEDTTVALESAWAEVPRGNDNGVLSSTTSLAVGSSMVVKICWNPDDIV